MKNNLTGKTACVLFVCVCSTMAVHTEPAQIEVDWPAFMQSHDMTFDTLPQNWTEAPHFGNAMVGSMLYQADNTLRLQIFRADVHDHRDNTYGWTAYSRPRLQIGHFSLHTVGKLTGCTWRKDLWNAELTGTLTTDKGQIQIRHFTHTDDMAIVTELTPSPGEQAYTWTWHPVAARTTRGGYPTDEAGIERFARGYGKHYAETLKVFKANPAGRQAERGPVSVWIQDFLVGGQYATAWCEQVKGQMRTHMVSIAHTYPESTAANTAVADVARCLSLDRSDWVDRHRTWWHDYYPRSFVTIPDKGLESLYWQTMYRFGCTARAGRCIVDTAGLWFQGKSWPYFTMDWNIQSALWPVYAANRLEQGQALVDRLYERRESLIEAVRPVAWQADSAYLPIAVAWDMQGSRDGDMRYYELVGNLPWVMHNMWWQYRFSMDDAMLRDKIFPLLRRSINLYLHMVEETGDGRLCLPPTFSPETGVFVDCNFDLALFKWGCCTLLKASERLGIDDPLIPSWRDVTRRLKDYPFDEYGFMLGRDRTSSKNHQHFSNLLMIYPLYLVNIEQPGTADVMRRSFERALGTAGPGQRQAMVQAHAGPIGTAQGLGDEALKSLKLLQGDLYPNGLWYESPCIESTLALANIIQDMFIQSWSDPAADESGPIRVFPATPSAWKDIEFHDLRTEGAFLVSAKRTAGQTEWVRLKSLAGEPCRVRPGFDGPVQITGDKSHTLKQLSPGLYQIDMKKGDEVLLFASKGPAQKDASAKRPNVILIMTDDQGYGDLACHGNPIIKTPNLDTLHSQSVRFTNFHVNAFCAPTRAALLTGRMSDRTHVRTTIYSRNHLNRNETTMAEFFKATGYQTGHFGKWHLGRNYPYRPMDRGFDQWVGHGDGGTGTSSDYWGNDKMNDTYWRNGTWETFSGFCTDIYFDEAMAFIEGAKDRPFFVYLATNVPHSPWNVPKAWRRPYEVNGTLDSRTVDFYATISRFDHNLGRLRTFLADKKLDDNTLIVYLTDNGTSGGDKVFNAGMRGKKGSVYEGGHRVPCFMHWPAGGFKKAVDIDRLANHFDLLPTLTDLCSLKAPARPQLEFDGKSLVPLIKGTHAPWPDRTVFMHVQNVREDPVKWMNSVVLTEQWRLINGKELYDIKNDPSQTREIAQDHPDVVAEMRQRYERHWNELDMAGNPYPRPIIGSRHEEETWLNPDAWIIENEKGPHTWNQSHVRSGANNSGFWPVELAADGLYQFDVRRWPKELDHPISASLPAAEKGDIDSQGRTVQPGKGKAIPAERVELVVGTTTHQATIGESDTGARFDVTLPAGATSVRAWLIDAQGRKRGAYYVYVKKISR